MQEYEKCQNPWSPYGEGNSGIFSFYECEVTEREVSCGGVYGFWEDEWPRGWVWRQWINEIERMNCPVDGKGVRKSTKLREWDDLWTGKASGDQRN